MAAAMNIAETPRAKTAASARLLAYSKMDIVLLLDPWFVFPGPSGMPSTLQRVCQTRKMAEFGQFFLNHESKRRSPIRKVGEFPQLLEVICFEVAGMATARYRTLTSWRSIASP